MPTKKSTTVKSHYRTLFSKRKGEITKVHVQEHQRGEKTEKKGNPSRRILCLICNENIPSNTPDDWFLRVDREHRTCICLYCGNSVVDGVYKVDYENQKFTWTDEETGEVIETNFKYPLN